MRHTVDEDDAKVPAGIESVLRRRRHNRERVETDSNRRISSVERSKAILAASPTEIFFFPFSLLWTGRRCEFHSYFI